MIKPRFLIILMLLLSPFLLACGGREWRTVEAKFGTEDVEIATCSVRQIERCEEIKRRLEAGKTVMTFDPEYIRILALDGEIEIAKNREISILNKIYPSNRSNEWIAEIWLQERGKLRDFELIASLPIDLALDLAWFSVYRYAMRFSNEYNIYHNPDNETLLNMFLDIHRRKKIRYTGALTLGIGTTGTRGCSFPVNPLLERSIFNEE